MKKKVFQKDTRKEELMRYSLKELRARKGLNQSETAEKLGVST